MKNKKALFFEKTNDKMVKCLLCPHQCQIEEGQSGICRGRVNHDGKLYTENYGQISSLGVDPIEKKPLYHFHPGTKILSLGTYGCNFSCDYCQNWRISQNKPQLRQMSPEEIIEIALQKDVIGIAYTYSEPLVWYEFVLETSKLAAAQDLKNVLVSNGYINQKPLEKLLPFIDAANIDLKSFNPDFYKKYCGGSLKPVLENIKSMESKIHLELTTLLITDTNDSETELKKLFSWIKDLNPEIPLHLSRYFPNYKFDKKATPEVTMKKAYKLAQKYLKTVHLGNMGSFKI